jgi:UDP-glucose 4-epimerase
MITGGAGFIGIRLAYRLASLGHTVSIYDSLPIITPRLLSELPKQGTYYHGDVMDLDRLKWCMSSASVNIVYHLAANADIRYGMSHPYYDVEQNGVGTINVLESMRECGVNSIVLASSAAVYGNAAFTPTSELAPTIQTSLYGTSKIMAEGVCSAYVEAYGFSARAMRMACVIGRGNSHGHLVDFARKLREDPARLEVLGDGNQIKGYVHVSDAVSAMILVADGVPGFEIYNVSQSGVWSVSDSVQMYREVTELDFEVEYAGGKKGWAGDAPVVNLNCSKLRAKGWRPRVSIEDSIAETIIWLWEKGE